MTWIRNSGGAPLSGGFTTPAFGRPGGNTFGSERWNSVEMFLNLVRSSEPTWYNQGTQTTSPYQNSNGWLASFPNGAVAEIIVKFTDIIASAFIRPGQYKATSASGVTLQHVTGSGITSNSSGVNLATCTVNVQGSGQYTAANGYDWRLRVTNSTGSTISLINDLALFHVDDETRFLSGKIFKVSFLAQFRNKYVVRLLDCLQGNMYNSTPQSSRIDSAAKIPTETNRFWGQELMPPSVAGKLMLELAAEYPNDPCASAALHITVPWWASPWRFNATTGTNRFEVVDVNGTVLTHGYANDTPLVMHGFNSGTFGGLSKFVPYYVVNATATDFQLADTPGGSPRTVPSTQAADFGYQIDRADRDFMDLDETWLTQLYSVRPTGKLKIEKGNEPWNSAFTHFHWLYGAPCWQAGLPNDPGRAQGDLSLRLWKAAETVGFSSSDTIRVCNFQATNDGFMTNACLNHSDVGVFGAGTLLKTVLVATAGGGEGCYAPYNYGADASFATLTLDQLASAGASTWTDTQWYDHMFRGTTNAAGNMAARKTNLNSQAPTARVSTYECGQHIDGNNTGGNAAVITRMQQWMASASGSSWLQDYRQRCMVDNSVVDMVYYILHGGWNTTSSYLTSWGLRPNTDGPSTPMADWFNSFTGP